MTVVVISKVRAAQRNRAFEDAKHEYLVRLEFRRHLARYRAITALHPSQITDAQLQELDAITSAPPVNIPVGNEAYNNHRIRKLEKRFPGLKSSQA